MKKEVYAYACNDRGTCTIKRVFQTERLISIATFIEHDCNSIFHEEIIFNPSSYCIERYKSYRNHLSIDSFTYHPGCIITHNLHDVHYKGYSADNAYIFIQAILLLPQIAENNDRTLLLYDHKSFVFTPFAFKRVNVNVGDNPLMYKILSPILAIAEYEKESRALYSFRSRDYSLVLLDK